MALELEIDNENDQDHDNDHPYRCVEILHSKMKAVDIFGI
jgi:hypothetical protein